jgi:hypothetical protein
VAVEEAGRQWGTDGGLAVRRGSKVAVAPPRSRAAGCVGGEEEESSVEEEKSDGKEGVWRGGRRVQRREGVLRGRLTSGSHTPPIWDPRKIRDFRASQKFPQKIAP